MTESLSIPLSFVLSGISAVFLSGIGIGSYMTRYRSKKQCDRIHDIASEEFAKVEREHEESVERLHTRIDEVLEKINSVMIAVSHLQGRTTSERING